MKTSQIVSFALICICCVTCCVDGDAACGDDATSTVESDVKTHDGEPESGEVDSAGIAALIEQLGAQSFRAREKATDELIRIGLLAAPAVAKAYGSKDPEVRVRAKMIMLNWIESREHETIRALQRHSSAKIHRFIREQQRQRAAEWLRAHNADVKRDEDQRVVAIRLSKIKANEELQRLAMFSESLLALDLSNSAVHDDQLAVLPRLSALKDLHLVDTGITDEGLTYVGKCPRLQLLYLSGTQVRGGGLQHLAGLRSLLELNLFETRIGDESLVHLQRIPQLERLSLCKTAITDDGLEELKPCRSLKSLNISQCSLTDKALLHLRGLKSLERLVCGGKGFTDDGFVHLVDLPSLKILEFWYTSVTDEGVKHFQRKSASKSVDVSNN